VWIGDDAAVVATPAQAWMVLASDSVVAGVHSDLALTSLSDLGWKAVAVCVSDLAAMGARPAHAVVAVSGGRADEVELLYEGVAAAAETFGVAVVGGDLTESPTLVVNVTVTGTCAGYPVLRSGARPGDGIWVTGPLGASAAGLRLLRDGSGAQAPLLVAAHARPRPLLAEGEAARRAGATAMIDVSDGFTADLAHVLDASGVGCVVDGVPVAPGATISDALSGGEDFELVWCVRPDVDVPGRFAQLGLRPPMR